MVWNVYLYHSAVNFSNLIGQKDLETLDIGHSAQSNPDNKHISIELCRYLTQNNFSLNQDNMFKANMKSDMTHSRLLFFSPFIHPFFFHRQQCIFGPIQMNGVLEAKSSCFGDTSLESDQTSSHSSGPLTNQT